MRRVCLFLIFLFAAGLSSAVEESGKLTEAQIQEMERRVETITDPAPRLFFQANIHRAKGELEQALQMLAKLIAQHPYEKRWIVRSELLSAKLYLELGMPDAAEVTARQVEFLNQGTEAAETARLFREKIKQVKKQSEESKQAE